MDEGKESNEWIEKIQELGLNWASCKALPKNDKVRPLQTVLDCLECVVGCAERQRR